MTPRQEPAPACVYLLADHLDAALACGEELLSAGFAPSSGLRLDSPANLAAQRAAVERIRGLELALMARVLRARDRAAELAGLDTRFKAVARLFASSTTLLVDAIADCTDSTRSDFETGDAITAYLRRRALLDASAAGLPEGGMFEMGEQFLVAERISLGPLMDLVAMFLDTLDRYFDLYDERGDEAAEAESEAA